MPEIDSLTISITASTASAGAAIDRLIGKLNQLKSAVKGASNFGKIAQAIKDIGEAADKVDANSGKKLTDLANGLNALAGVKSLSRLSNAGAIISDIAQAVNEIDGSAGARFEGVAKGIESLGNVNAAKLKKVRDALKQNRDFGTPIADSKAMDDMNADARPSAADQGAGAMRSYGAMTVFTYMADEIRSATQAIIQYSGAMRQSQVIETEFVESANQIAGAVKSIGAAVKIPDVQRQLLNSPILPIPLLETLEANLARSESSRFKNWTMAPLEDTDKRFASISQEGSKLKQTFEGIARAARSIFEKVSGAGNAVKGFGDKIKTALTGRSQRPADLDKQIEAAKKEYELAKKLPEQSLKDAGFNESNPRWADLMREATKAYADEIENARIKLEQLEAQQQNMGLFGNIAGTFGKFASSVSAIPRYLGGQFASAIHNAVSGLGRFFASVKRIAMYRAIRSALRAITQGFREGIKNLYQWSNASNGHFAKSMDNLATSAQYLKNSLGTLAAPLLEALAPALSTIIDLLVTAINYFNMFVAAISGKTTYTAARKVAKSWGDAAKSASNGAKSAAKEIQKTILGFDELNKLSEQSSGGGGGGGGGGGANFNDMFEERELSGGWQNFSNAIELALQDTLSRITMIIGAAELAVGAVLLFSGANPALGLGLIASGAIGMGSAIFAHWEGISEEVKLAVAGVEAALGGGLAVGAILAFSGGNIPLGIGLMAAALSAGMGSVTIAWNAVGDTVKEKAQAIATLVGGAALGVGAVLTFAGHPHVGIPLMLSGLSVGAVAVNWDFIAEKLRGPIGRALALASSASLMLGILAILAGAVPLGLGLILLGASGIASTVAANWDSFKSIGSNAIKKVKEGWETIKSLAVTAWVALKEKVSEWSKNAWEVIKDKTKTWTQTVRANIAKGAAWFENGWNVIKDKTHTWTQNVRAGIAKGAAWFKDGWTVIKDKTKTWAQTVKASVAKGKSWFKDGWTAIKDKTKTWTQNVKAGIAKGSSWFENGWTVIKDKTKTWTQTVKAGIAKGTSWFADGWTAIKSVGQKLETIVKVGLAKANTWIADAWTAVRMQAGEVYRTVKAGVDKANTWVADAWIAARMTAGEVFRTVKAGVDKASTWVNDAWTVLRINAGEVYKTVKASLDKGSKWASDAWTILSQPDSIEKAVNMGLNLAKNAITKLWNDIQQAWSDFISGRWLSVNIKYNPPEGGNYDEETGVWQGDSWITSGKAAVDFYGHTIEIPAMIYPYWSIGEDLDIWIQDNYSGGSVIKDVLIQRGGLLAVLGTVCAVATKYWSGGSIIKEVLLKRGGLFEICGTVVGYIYKNYWGGNLQKAIDLIRGGKLKEGKTVLGTIFQNWWGGNVEKGVGLFSNFGKTVFDWLKLKLGPDSKAPVSLAPKWDVAKPKPVLHLTDSDLSSNAKISLTKNYSDNPLEQLGLTNLKAKVAIGLTIDDSNKSVVIKPNSTKTKYTVKRDTKALGGMFFGGLWHNIPQYAGGTLNAHGSLFLAGEAGPEIVGHVGGRTEVLNKSQLASAMFSAVRAAMAPASANFAEAAQSMMSEDRGIDANDFADMIQMAVESAMARSNDYDRQQVELLRQINEKEFSAEITTSGMAKAQTRMNRRAGTTIVPVGT